MSRWLNACLLALHTAARVLRHWLDRWLPAPPRRGPALVPIPLSEQHPSRQIQRRLPGRPS